LRLNKINKINFIKKEIKKNPWENNTPGSPQPVSKNRAIDSKKIARKK